VVVYGGRGVMVLLKVRPPSIKPPPPRPLVVRTATLSNLAQFPDLIFQRLLVSRYPNVNCSPFRHDALPLLGGTITSCLYENHLFCV
jgi:hypothetical protein